MNNYTKTDQQLHWLSQIIAKANRTFVPKKEDDSHTNLYFDVLGNRICGRWIKTTKKEILFTLNLGNQCIEILDVSHQVLASIPSINRHITAIEKEIESLLPSLGLKPAGFTEKLHFEISKYKFSEETVPSITKQRLNEWKHFRQLANTACSQVLGHAQIMEEVRIWPHHFDTGIYIMVNPNLGVGFGLAMEDEMAGAPYFYMSAYPIIGALKYENLPVGNGWKWELGEHWKGAILPINELEGKADPDQWQILRSFILESFHWFVHQP